MVQQNTSSAVMQSRYEPADSLDDFPTPPWATRALCEWLVACRYALPSDHIHEPACNRGHMVTPLREYFPNVTATDIHDYGCGFQTSNFLSDPQPASDWVITNPPFKNAEAFIQTAVPLVKRGIAVLTRTSFLESVSRYKSIFAPTPPSHVLQFSERVVIHKAKLSPKGSTATSYCWVIWRKPITTNTQTTLHWIRPCRKRLERDTDYTG